MNVINSCRNIKNTGIVTAKDLNVYELVNFPNVLVTKKSMEEIIRRIG
jgi:ribosomal protein L4